MADVKMALQNVSKRMRVYVLAGNHLEGAAPDHPHRYQNVKRVTVHHSKSDGGFHARVRHVAMASSLRIPAGATVEVHPDAAHAPAIKAAIARNELRVVKLAEEKPAADEVAAVETSKKGSK